jgi:phytoene dehydrogenase-like protein
VKRGAKTIAIVGAGPGGLTAAMILARRGYHVRVFEKEAQVGGRNAALRVGDFTFDTGPTFLMVPQILEEVFALAGTTVAAHLDLRRIDPLYRLRFSDGRDFSPAVDHDETAGRIEAFAPGEGEAYHENASVTDPTLAPAGKSTLYVLVPVPNLSAGAQWGPAETAAFRERILGLIEQRAGIPGLREFDRCYLVGGGTHPGSGLPTIYESGRIAADLIDRDIK